MKKKMSSGLIVVMLLVGLLSFQPHELESDTIGYLMCLNAAHAMAVEACFNVPYMIWNSCFESSFGYWSGFCIVFQVI